MGKISVRLARPSDLDAIEALENRAFRGDRLSRRSLRRYVGAPSVAMLSAFSDAAFAGYALIGLRRGSKVASLYSIAVDPAFTGRGLGKALMQAAEGVARGRERSALTLEVRSDNGAAIALYERLGYERFGVFEDYYEDGASALRMRKALG